MSLVIIGDIVTPGERVDILAQRYEPFLSAGYPDSEDELPRNRGDGYHKRNIPHGLYSVQV